MGSIHNVLGLLETQIGILPNSFDGVDFVGSWVGEKWILYGTFLTDVNFNALSYSQDALANITTTLRMDRCVLIY